MTSIRGRIRRAADLAALKPAFAKFLDAPADDGSGNTFGQLITSRYPGLNIVPIHHAGSSSGVVDGAAALLLASGDYAAKQGWKPARADYCHGEYGG